MPKMYEKIRDRLISQGKSTKEAKALAAKIYNSRHPGNPVGRYSHLHEHMKKRKGK